MRLYTTQVTWLHRALLFMLKIVLSREKRVLNILLYRVDYKNLLL